MPKVTLKQPHTHAGVPYQKGERIDVTDDQAAWLAEHKVIASPHAEAATDKPAATKENSK